MGRGILMTIGILSAGILIGIGIGLMVKYILDGIFGRDAKIIKELEAENESLRARIKEYESGH
ncbi:MAG: hypothetical protein FJ149_12695 [Euryarchaeota archaeon]|nr:hypothetical protein [Euryarchaeota archaeon]